MKSPFPGMDPYLEAHWGDMHARLIVYACDQLSKQMPRELRVRVEEHVTLHFASGESNGASAQRGRFPDVRVVEHPASGTAPASPSAPVAIAKPLVVPVRVEEGQTQRSLRVIDTRSGNRVVTAIEILSPANKIGEQGRAAYFQRQQDLLQGGVSLVEIDLLREGQYVLAVSADLLPPTYQSPYRICVFRGYRPDQAEVYRASLRERLPTISIPLRESDPDAYLDLQELINHSYENGGYEVDINYRLDPSPPLQGEDAVWADSLLREQGRR